LGTAVRQAFTQTSDGQFEVLSLAFSRSHELGLVSLDLTKEDEVEKVFRNFRPNSELGHLGAGQLNPVFVTSPQVVIHCAAERRPDVAEKVW